MDSVFEEALMLDFDLSAEDVLEKKMSNVRNIAIEEGKKIPGDTHKDFQLTSFEVKDSTSKQKIISCLDC